MIASSTMIPFRPILLILSLAAALLPAPLIAASGEAKKSVLLIAGKPSHGPGEHEHIAGVLLLAKCLNQSVADRVEVKTFAFPEWPNAQELAQADTVLIYGDGEGGHPAFQGNRLEELAVQMKRGCGFVCLHYAVEPSVNKGRPEFTEWLGGYFETDWSVNPHWQADFKELPKHAICNGVKPFSTSDEWYFHMRFTDGMKGVTPVLSAIAPAETMSRPNGGHSGNDAVREEVAAGKPQFMAWAVERADSGRGFGFTGGHYHKGWGNDDQRKLVLNAILWTAKAEVPPTGVNSQLTAEDLQANVRPSAGMTR